MERCSKAPLRSPLRSLLTPPKLTPAPVAKSPSTIQIRRNYLKLSPVKPARPLPEKLEAVVRKLHQKPPILVVNPMFNGISVSETPKMSPTTGQVFIRPAPLNGVYPLPILVPSNIINSAIRISSGGSNILPPMAVTKLEQSKYEKLHILGGGNCTTSGMSESSQSKKIPELAVSVTNLEPKLKYTSVQILDGGDCTTSSGLSEPSESQRIPELIDLEPDVFSNIVDSQSRQFISPDSSTESKEVAESPRLGYGCLKEENSDDSSEVKVGSTTDIVDYENGGEISKINQLNNEQMPLPKEDQTLFICDKTFVKSVFHENFSSDNTFETESVLDQSITDISEASCTKIEEHLEISFDDVESFIGFDLCETKVIDNLQVLINKIELEINELQNFNK